MDVDAVDVQVTTDRDAEFESYVFACQARLAWNRVRDHSSLDGYVRRVLVNEGQTVDDAT